MLSAVIADGVGVTAVAVVAAEVVAVVSPDLEEQPASTKTPNDKQAMATTFLTTCGAVLKQRP